MRFFRDKSTLTRQDLDRQQKRRALIVPQQDMTEFSGFLRLLLDHNVKSYLEIGCRFGGTFNMVMRVLGPQTRGVAVDLPGGNWGTVSSEAHLRQVVSDLSSDCFDAKLILGNSQSTEVKNAVSALGPFDAALIDGDHLYEGVKADWAFYGHLAKIVAFHDVAGNGVRQRTSGLKVEVDRLWSELKKDGYTTHEFIRQDSGMGIGVLIR